MAKKKVRAQATAFKPGTFVGIHPDTGVLHRLTISGKSVTIERQPYVSDNPDGWIQYYVDITDETSKHQFLILKILQNPADWPLQ